MHKTEAGEKVKALKKEAQELARKAKNQKKAVSVMRTARVTVTNLQALAAKRLSQAQAQKLEAGWKISRYGSRRRLRIPRREQRLTPTLWPPGERERG